MNSFQCINIVRKPDGSLRSWEEYDALATTEQWIDGQNKYRPPTSKQTLLSLKVKESERRSRV